MSDKRPIIIIKKNKRHHAAHHGGAWKVAYADFVTAMMSFFLVMWLVSQSEQVRASVGGYFRDPLGGPGVGLGVLNGGLKPVMESGSSKDKRSETEEERQRRQLRDKAQEIWQAIQASPELAGIADHIEFEVTKEGLRIRLMEGDDATFFQRGSAVLSEKGSLVLAAIARAFETTPNSIVIEGHTDGHPYGKNADYTNWELSSDRANAARRVLVENDIQDRRLDAIRGFAATRPRFPDAADARNRRIEIVVLNPSRASAP